MVLYAYNSNVGVTKIPQVDPGTCWSTSLAYYMSSDLVRESVFSINVMGPDGH